MTLYLEVNLDRGLSVLEWSVVKLSREKACFGYRMTF